jgi:uncharacterized protein DUF4157
MAEHEEIRSRFLARRMPQQIESPRHDAAPAAAAKGVTSAPSSRVGGSLLQLQRQYGNRYVQRVVALARSEAEGSAMPDVERSIESSRGGGQALDHGLQSRMGGALGADFSGVRVHTNAHADGLNHSLQARAFTVGQDIYFRQGEYNPGSSTGRELLAHELTHVVQQTPGTVQTKADDGGCTCGSSAAQEPQMKLAVSQPGDQFEQEADRVAAAVMHQEVQGSAEASSAPAVQRQMPEEEDKKPLHAKYRDDRTELHVG